MKELINQSLGKLCTYKQGWRDEFRAIIASEVSDKNVVGLDLMDGFPITFLADIRYISDIEDIVYTSEAGRSYSKNDILEIAEGNQRLADIILSLCYWQHPETVFEELLQEGEIDENGNIIEVDNIKQPKEDLNMKQYKWDTWFVLSILWFFMCILIYVCSDTPPNSWVLNTLFIICTLNLIGCIIIGCESTE